MGIQVIRFMVLFVGLSLLLSCGGGGGDAPPATPVNHAPIANAGPDQDFRFGSGLVNLDGSGSSDPDGNSISFAWVFDLRPGGSTATLTGDTTSTPSFTPDQTGLYRLTLTVSDGSLSSVDQVEVDVAVNVIPVANAGPDQDLNPGVTVTLDGTASSDPENDPLTYTWTQIAGYGPDVTGGTGTLSGPTPSFTAPATPATLLFDLRVNDGAGDSFADRVQINIFADNAHKLFVSTGGNDGNPGTRAQPFLHLATAINAAQVQGADVYIDSIAPFTPSSTVTVLNGVSLYGGYNSNENWSRANSARSSIASVSTTAMSANSLSSATLLDQLQVSSANAAATGSSYVMIMVNSTGLIISNSTLSPGDGGDGNNGAPVGGQAAPGQPGAPGAPGCESSGGFCNTCDRPLGGNGGTGAVGSGGSGGQPGRVDAWGSPGSAGTSGGAGPGSGGPGTPNNMGNWNPDLIYVGQDGFDGFGGVNGIPGIQIYVSAGYSPSHGHTGDAGQHGGNAGGGGGGGGGDDNCDSYGGAGGGGGGGGTGGTGGNGGQSGGGSFGVYLWASDVTINNTHIIGGEGGHGGNGTTGQLGGTGGLGGWGGVPALPNAGNLYGGSGEQDDGSNGARGGNGGYGGNGGHGGGGAGGPAVGVFSAAASSATLNSVNFTAGVGGTGGLSPGNDGPDGHWFNTLNY